MVYTILSEVSVIIRIWIKLFTYSFRRLNGRDHADQQISNRTTHNMVKFKLQGSTVTNQNQHTFKTT